MIDSLQGNPRFKKMNAEYAVYLSKQIYVPCYNGGT